MADCRRVTGAGPTFSCHSSPDAEPRPLARCQSGFFRSSLAPPPINHPRLILAALGLATVASLAAAEPAKPVAPRFSAGNMDPTVDPRKDFAHFAWGSWVK